MGGPSSISCRAQVKPKPAAKPPAAVDESAAQGQNKKHILCKFYKNPALGKCKLGRSCPYNHNKKQFDDKGKYVGKGKGKGKRKGKTGGVEQDQDNNGAAQGEWDPPVGLGYDNHTACLNLCSPSGLMIMDSTGKKGESWTHVSPGIRSDSILAGPPPVALHGLGGDRSSGQGGKNGQKGETVTFVGSTAEAHPAAGNKGSIIKVPKQIKCLADLPNHM